MKQKIPNNHSICCVGLQRSGNHTIINWLGSQINSTNTVYFLNCINLVDNPFISACPEGSKNSLIFNNLKIDRQAESMGDISQKDYIIYSYEDKDLHTVFSKTNLVHLDTCLGSSLKHYNILILRDPYNLLASRLQREITGGKNTISVLNNIDLFISIYKQYIKEFLGFTNIISKDKICINYNLWTKDKLYRQKLCDDLDIPFNDTNFQTISHIGGGSSFDRHQRYINNVDDLHNRWKLFTGHEIMEKLLIDQELKKISQLLFDVKI